MESTPVSGVATRKDNVAPSDAPERLSPIAAGNTPHEHNGNGAPIKAPLMTGQVPLPPNTRFIKLSGIQTLIKPAANKPNNSQGAASRLTSKKLTKNLFNNSTSVSRYIFYYGNQSGICFANAVFSETRSPISTNPKTLPALSLNKPHTPCSFISISHSPSMGRGEGQTTVG